MTGLYKKWKEFFDDFYFQGWGWTIDDERTQREVDGVLELLKPPRGSHLLDWCGGWGRHAIEFAKRGFEVTLLDFALNHIEMAEAEMKKAGVELKLIHADFRETPVGVRADYAVNLFTAGIGYLTEQDDVIALTSLYRAMKPGGKLLIDTMNLFWLVRNYKSEGWSENEDGTIRHLSKREFDYFSNRNRSSEILLVNNEEREAELDHRIYSPAELIAVLRRTGFNPTELYGDFDGSEFSFDSPRIVMVSEKPK